MSANLETVPKQDLIDRVRRMAARLSGMKSQTERLTRRGVQIGTVVAGGAVAGALRRKMPQLPGMQVESHLLLGGLAIGLGVTDLAGDYSDELALFGAGMLAGDAERRTFEALA